MGCSILEPWNCTIGGVSSSIADSVLGGVADAITAGENAMFAILTSWVVAPSHNVCSGNANASDTGGSWVTLCNSDIFKSPSVQLREWLLPISIIVAVAGLLWQALHMVVSRKGDGLIMVARGVWSLAIWTAIGIAGTQLALVAGDSWSTWIISQAVGGRGDPSAGFTKAVTAMLASPLAGEPVIIVIIIGIVVMIVAIIQSVLMVFRQAAIVILAGQLQLAAAGSFTRATATWLPKVTVWTLSLVFYKPITATVYAIGFMIMNDQNLNGSTYNFIMGIAVLALAVIALPVTLRLFNWMLGGSQPHSNGLFAALALATAARGITSLAGGGGGGGGNSAGEHARFLDQSGPGGNGGGGGGSGPTGASGGGGSVIEVGADGTVSDSPASPGAGATRFAQTGDGAYASTGESVGAASASEGAAAGGAGGSAAATGASSGAAAGAGGGAAAAGASAAGPVGIAVGAAIVVGAAAKDAATNKGHQILDGN